MFLKVVLFNTFNYLINCRTVVRYTIISIIMLTVSCHPAEKKSAASLQFNWQIAGQIPSDSEEYLSPGLAGPVAGISNDRLIVAGGSNFPDGMPWNGGSKKYYSRAYVFKKEKDTLINLKQRFYLPYAVAYGANCSTTKGLVVAGGENDSGAIKQVLLLNWNENKNRLDFQELPPLPYPLTNGMMATYNDVLYFAGGADGKYISDKLYAFNLNKPLGWKEISTLPHPVTNATFYAIKEAGGVCLYLVGGRMRTDSGISNFYKEVYKYNLNENKWIQKASLPYALSAQTGIAFNDTTLLVFSGDRGKTFHATEILLNKIAKEKDPVKKKTFIAQKNKLQENHPGFENIVLSYNIHEDIWKKTDSIPFPGQVTTTAVKWGKDIFIPSGEIRAGVRTPDIILGVLK